MTDLTQNEGGGGQQSIPASLAWAHPLVQDWFVEKFGTEHIQNLRQNLGFRYIAVSDG